MKKIFVIYFGLLSLYSSSVFSDEPIYSFGVLSQRSPSLTAEYWNPILKWISDDSGVKLLLKTERSAPDSNKEIKKESYDFVYSNTLFEEGMPISKYEVILAPLSSKIKGQIVTLPEYNINKISDLQNFDVGFPSKAAFVGYCVPMSYLNKEKIDVNPIFGGNQEGIMGQLKAKK